MINRLFDKIADGLGTNLCITVFFLIAVVPLYFQMPRTILEWQQWLSGTAIQLIALAVLQKGTRQEGAKNLQLLLDTHDATMAEMLELKDMHQELHMTLNLFKTTNIKIEQPETV